VKWCNARSEREGLIPAFSVNGSVYRIGEFGNDSRVVTWNGSANGYRLLAEPEWEWAARGGASSQNYTYSGSDDLNMVAWHIGNSGAGTKPVGSKMPNELGVSDMSGNVYEWFWDANGSFRRFRGGSWANAADNCTVASRGFYERPDSSLDFIGFRLARNAGNQP
jgi:sulfatase modifying factor 1